MGASNYPPELTSGQIADLEGDRFDPLCRKDVCLDYWKTAPKLSESKENEPKEKPKQFNFFHVVNVYESTSRPGAYHVVQTTGNCLATADSIVFGVPTYNGYRKMKLENFFEWQKTQDMVVIDKRALGIGSERNSEVYIGQL